jgi:hypothetical protein
MSNLLVQNIKHTNGTTSIVVNSSGHVATDTIKGNSTAGSISVVGEGNSTTTNLQQGLAKMWCQYDGSGTAQLDDSFNSSGITDHGTGTYTLLIANDMSNDDYAVGGLMEGMNYQFASEATKQTTGVKVETMGSGGSKFDCTYGCIIIHGDLA